MTDRLMAQTRLRANGVAAQADDLFRQELDSAVRTIADHRWVHGDEAWNRPGGFPAWLEGVFVWDGDAIEVLSAPPGDGLDLAALLERRMVAGPAFAPGVSLAKRPELIYERFRGRPLVIASLQSIDVDMRPIVIAASVNAERLATDLVEPLVAADDGLELAPAGTSSTEWNQRLSGALQFWAIRPAQAFVREQRSTVLTQTLAYLGLSTLALATLLATMWFLTRVVRREMALAEMKANFVADVSHELKTPLALIRLFSETLQSGRIASEEKRNEYYDVIIRESTRLTHLINNILDFARIDAGGKEYTLAPTDVGEVVREIHESYRAQLEHAGFEHELKIDPGLPRVDADRSAIAQVMVNLITNAIKYSEDERFLLIELSEDTRRGRRGVLISVHDRGIGIRPEDRAYLTEGFYRASDSRVRQQGGTGLGLALVKHIVDTHGGSFYVESRLVKGSTFRVFLPASDVDTSRSGAGGSDGDGA